MKSLGIVAALGAMLLLNPSTATAGVCDQLEKVLTTAEESGNTSDSLATKGEWSVEKAGCYEIHAEIITQGDVDLSTTASYLLVEKVEASTYSD